MPNVRVVFQPKYEHCVLCQIRRSRFNLRCGSQPVQCFNSDADLSLSSVQLRRGPQPVQYPTASMDLTSNCNVDFNQSRVPTSNAGFINNTTRVSRSVPNAIVVLLFNMRTSRSHSTSKCKPALRVSNSMQVCEFRAPIQTRAYKLRISTSEWGPRPAWNSHFCCNWQPWI